ncbi:MAG: hypothetical protein A2219_00775 [Elusimicrobia bacterium RIFOXYA2_FULL_50_26]|nr:MAG: hypothetical protein A2219_00775 [Elusimicrobia bacterium RIFOXYA2_FULL_50_26]OGS23192.1 MAG: hypothetical protein A2314_06245 [Elusimicrobia bacterium RIFOXYB2_FULL_50_12]
MPIQKMKVAIQPLSKIILSVEEEQALIKRCRASEEAAQDELFKVYFPLVASIARKYRNFFPQAQFEELMEEGNFGLFQAIGHFDPCRHTRFSSYAWFWVVHSIQDYVTRMVAFLKVPERVVCDLRKITRFIQEAAKENKEVSIEDISVRLEMKMEKIRELLSEHCRTATPVSLDQSLDEDENVQTLKDILPDGEKSGEAFLEELEGKGNVAKLLGQLNENEARVIEWRFGFIDAKYHSLKEIAKKLKISPQKVRDLEIVAIIKLKRLIAAS